MRDTGWPNAKHRRALVGISVAMFVMLFAFSWLTGGASSPLPYGTRLVGSLGVFAIAVDDVSGGQSFEGLWLMVALGDPRIFGICLLTLGAIAVIKRDYRLAIFCVVSPVLAEVLTQYLAKPTFYLLHGGIYGYPSGHATATITICVAAYVTARRLASPQTSRTVLVTAVLVSLMGTVGVVINDMHPIRDAIGAVFISAGTMALMARLIFFAKPRPTARVQSITERPGRKT